MITISKRQWWLSAAPLARADEVERKIEDVEREIEDVQREWWSDEARHRQKDAERGGQDVEPERRLILRLADNRRLRRI